MYKIESNDLEAGKFYEKYKDAIVSILDNEVIELQKEDSEYNKSAIEFLEKYKKDKFLKELLTSRPSKLIDFNLKQQKKIQTKFKLDDKDIRRFDALLYNIFVTKLYSDSNIFSKIEFYRSKRIIVCPYCSQNYIFAFEKTNIKNDIQVKHHIDHFFPKSIYPLLAFSYYNLIPICVTCNMSNCKGNLDPLGSEDNHGNSQLKISNPYEFDSKTISFSFNLNNFNYFDSDDISINYDFKSPYSIEAYQLFFGLKSLYNHHTPIVFELIIKKQFWSSSICAKNYEDILTSGFSSNIIQAFFGFNILIADFGKRPLAKLMYDTSKYYDKIYKLGINGKPEILDKIRNREK